MSVQEILSRLSIAPDCSSLVCVDQVYIVRVRSSARCRTSVSRLRTGLRAGRQRGNEDFGVMHDA